MVLLHGGAARSHSHHHLAQKSQRTRRVKMTRKRRAWACLLHGIVSFPFEQQVVVFVFACPSPFIHAKEKGQEAEETEEAEQIKKTEEEET